MWRQPPIWEPKGTKFRPYSITTLIFFYIGRFFGRLFDSRIFFRSLMVWGVTSTSSSSLMNSSACSRDNKRGGTSRRASSAPDARAPDDERIGVPIPSDRVRAPLGRTSARPAEGVDRPGVDVEQPHVAYRPVQRAATKGSLNEAQAGLDWVHSLVRPLYTWRLRSRVKRIKRSLWYSRENMTGLFSRL